MPDQEIDSRALAAAAGVREHLIPQTPLEPWKCPTCLHTWAAHRHQGGADQRHQDGDFCPCWSKFTSDGTECGCTEQPPPRIFDPDQLPIRH